MEIDEEQIQYFGWGLLVILSARCGVAALMHWGSIDEFLLEFSRTLLPAAQGEEFAWTIPIFQTNPGRQ